MATTTLYSRGWFGSKRVMIEESCLGFYEQQFGSDRVKRVLFDRLESVVVWRRFPWDRAVVYSLIFGLPGFCLTIPGLFMDEPGLWGTGGVLLFVWGLIIGRYLLQGRSTILVNRDGKARRIQVIVSRRRLTDFLDTLDEAVISYQFTHQKDEPLEPLPPTEPSAFAEAPALTEPPTSAGQDAEFLEPQQ